MSEYPVVTVANMPRIDSYKSSAQIAAEAVLKEQALLDQFACAFLSRNFDVRDSVQNQMERAYLFAGAALRFRAALLQPKIEKAWRTYP